MYRIDNANSVASPPTVPGAGTEGYFTEGGGATPATEVPDWWFNMVQEEIRAVVVAAGLTPSKTDNGQLEEAVHGALGIYASGSNITTDTDTFEDRVLIASTSVRCQAAHSAIIASEETNANTLSTSAAHTAIIASTDSSSTTSSVAGSESALLGTTGSRVLNGASCAVAGASESDVGGAAKKDCFVGGSTASTASGNQSAVIGSDDSVASGAQSAVVASYGSDVSGQRSAAVASNTSEVTDTVSAVIASTGCIQDGSNAVLIGSNAESVDNNVLSLGYSGSGITATGSNQNISLRASCQTGDVDTITGGTFNTGALDYAEVFENAAGVAMGPGLLVSLSGAGCALASSGDRILGVISATPGVVGGAARLGWHGQHATDEWGRRLFDEAGAPVPSPDYDPSRKYVPRDERPDEWAVVGLLGQLLVRVDASVAPGDLVGPGVDGVGTKDSKAKGRPVECMSVVRQFDADAGYAVALCLVG